MTALNLTTRIDKAANDFYIKNDKKSANIFMCHASTAVKTFATQKCLGSKWNVEELYSILLIDTWRLLNAWKPADGKKFHWLMFKQLKNKTINFIHKTEGRPHKICPSCKARQECLTDICNFCRTPLKVSERKFEELGDYGDNKDALNELITKELIEKLLKDLESDPKTLKIVHLLLDGYSKGEISKEIGIASNAVNNRIKKCRKIINKLDRGIYEVGFSNKTRHI